MHANNARFGTRLLVLAMILTASGGCTSEPPAVVDLPAKDLDARVQILEYPKEQTLITIQFLVDAKVVQVTAHLSCDGFKLEWIGLGYVIRVPKVSGRTEYNCLYLHPSGLSGVIIEYRDPPAITSISPGATVARTGTYSVKYTAGSAKEVSGNAWDSSTPEVKSVDGSPERQSDDGSYDSIDTNALSSGPGFLSLGRVYEGTLTKSSFKSTTYTYWTSTKLNVIWA